MNPLAFTRHAEQRMAQRGLRERDVELMMLLGTEVEGGLMITSRDVDEAIRALKALAGEVARLRGKRLVEAEGRLVTAYHTSKATMRRLLRAKDERAGRPPRRDAR